MTQRSLPPGPSGYLGLKGSFAQNSLQILTDCWKQYGDIYRIKLLPGMTWHLAIHPDMAEHILTGHGKKYEKPRSMHKPLALLFGEGMLTSEGNKWRRQRRMMQPAFHRQSLMNLASVMTRLSQQTAEMWERYPEDKVIDLMDEMQQLTLNIVGETLLGADLDDHGETLKKSFLNCALFVARRTGSPVKLPIWLPLRKNKEFILNRDLLNLIAMKIIEARRRNGSKTTDLLTMLLEARDADTGDGMTDEEIRDEVITILFAGHETVSVTLCWTFLMLSKHPDVADELQNELESVLCGNPPGPEDFMRLPYTRMVIEETLRLFPPAWFQPREPLTEDTIGGYRIPPKTLVMVAPFLTHRHPDYWSDPEGFNPTRFVESEVSKRHKFAYLPFGGGPRICIGNQFAMMEAVLILSTLAQRFRLETVTEQPVEMAASYILRPKNGLKMRLKAAKPTAISAKVSL